MRRFSLLTLLSMLIAVAAYGYDYRYWIDNDLSNVATGTGSGETQFNVDVSTLGSGIHALHVQARNSSGVWSGVRTRYFLVDKAVAATTARYWIDDNTSAVHNGVATSGIIDVDITGLRAGIHAIHYQTIGANGTPSVVRTRYFLLEEAVAATTARYWIDDDMTTLHTGVATSGIIELDLSKVGSGIHAVHYQTVGANNVASTTRTRYFYIESESSTSGPLTCHLWIDDDTENTVIQVLSEDPIEIDLGDLTGEHLLHVAIYDDQGTLVGEKTHIFQATEAVVPVRNIVFVDATAKTICLQYWDQDSDGELSESEAAAVTNIGNVFQGTKMTSFDELRYFTGLTSISDMAFANCDMLQSITIPKNMKTVSGGLFYFCDALTSVKVDEANTWLDSRDNCNAIIETASSTLLDGCKTTVIPDGITAIGDLAFYHIHGMTSLTIPGTVTSIGMGALFGLTDLTSLTLPKSVTSLGDEVIGNTNSLMTLVVEAGNPVYDSRDNCNAIIETATNKLVAASNATVIPTSVTSIGYCAYDSYPITSLHIPANVTAIDELAVRLCPNLEEITVDARNMVYNSNDNCNAIMETATGKLLIGCKTTEIPDDTRSIGTYAFLGCDELQQVTIPKTVTEIGSSAFKDCSHLTLVRVGNATPVDIQETTFTNRHNAVLYVPAGSADLYRAADFWKDFNPIIEDAAEEEQPEPGDATDISTVEDAIYIDPIEAISGKEFTVDIRLKNSMPATTYAFDLILPDGVEIVKNEKGKIIDQKSYRHSDHQCVSNALKNNTYRFSALSLTSAQLEGNDGIIRSVNLKVADDVTQGDYIIKVEKAQYILPDGSVKVVDDSYISISFRGFIPGDVNGNGFLEVGDAVTLMNYFMGKETANFVEEAAYLNDNDEIDMGDAVIIVNKLMGRQTSEKPAATSATIDLPAIVYNCDDNSVQTTSQQMDDVFKSAKLTRDGFFNKFVRFYANNNGEPASYRSSDAEYFNQVVIRNVGQVQQIMEVVDGESVCLLKWLVSADDLYQAGNGRIQHTVVYTDTAGDSEFTITLQADVSGVVKSYDVPVSNYIREYWNATLTYTSLNTAVPQSTSDADASHCYYKNDLNAPFTTSNGILKVTGAETVSYKFNKALMNGRTFMVGGSSVTYSLQNSDCELWATIKVGSFTIKELVAWIVNGEDDYPKNYVYLNDGIAVSPYQTSALSNQIAMSLLNDQTSGAPFCAYITAVGTNCSGNEIAITFNGSDHFQVNWITPVKCTVNDANDVYCSVDVGEWGSYIKLEDMVNPSDWRGRLFSQFSTYWSYYGVTGITVDLSDVRTDMNDADWTSASSTLPSTMSVGIYDSSGNLLENSGSMPSPVTFKKQSGGNQIARYGYLSYKNNGSAISTSFHIYVKAQVEYKWGTLTSDWIAINVNPLN